ncbi:lipopolysaccharide biosynthesis protein [Nocardia lasii]|uniref:Lipopolysaccharide biosynthesis protein n=1 Tax=Nocardia lasii TaxID=1616107 RepID=A0ABW1JN66_9NOCA
MTEHDRYLATVTTDVFPHVQAMPREPGAHRHPDNERGGGGGGKHVKSSPLAVLRDIGFVSFGKYGQYLVTFITVPLIARVLGAHGLGLLAMAMSAYFIGSLIVDLGITSFMAARLPEAEENQGPGPRFAVINQLRGDYLAVRVTLLLVLGLALGAGLLLRVPEPVQMILLGLFAGGFWSMSEDWVLIGQGRFGASTLYQGIGRLGYLALLLGVLPRFPSAQVAVLCLLVSSAPTVVATWIDTSRHYGRPSRPREVGALVRTGAPVFASRLLITTYGQGAAAIYSVVLNAAALGLYSAGDRLVRALQSLLDPIGFALLPRMARRSGDGTFWRDSMRVLAACVGLAALVSAMVWVSAPLLIDVIFGTEFHGATALLRIEILILPATTITSFITTAILPVRQDTFGVLTGAVIGTVIAACALGLTFHTRSVHTLVYGSVLVEYSVAAWYLARVRMLVLRDRHSKELLA